MLLAVIIIALVVLLLLRMHIAFALAIVGFCGLAYLRGIESAISTSVDAIVDAASTYPLITIPLFILMAQFIIASGIADELFDIINGWVRKIPGGLGIATIGTGGAFGAISGSSVAAAATLAGTASEAMIRHGYPIKSATGLVAIVGTLAVLIPPSNILVLYGLLTDAPIDKLLIAGIVPGLFALFALVCMLQLQILVDPQFKNVRDEEVIAKKISMQRQIYVLVPVMLLFLAVIGVLFFGVASPVEAASLGAAGALIVVIFNKRFSWSTLMQALVETVQITAMIILIIGGAAIFGYVLTMTQVTQSLVQWIGDSNLSAGIVLAVILIIYLILGCFMDQVAILVLTLPLTVPIIDSFGFSEIWFGVIVVVTCEIGLVTPPLGLNAYVVAQYTNTSLGTVFRGVIPYVLTMMVVLAILAMVPSITLWLPNLM